MENEKNDPVFLNHISEDFQDLHEALLNCERICNGRPDIYQYYQNELSKTLARFILKPYFTYIKEKEDGKPE
jgi:hypothetical protein